MTQLVTVPHDLAIDIGLSGGTASWPGGYYFNYYDARKVRRALRIAWRKLGPTDLLMRRVKLRKARRKYGR